MPCFPTGQGQEHRSPWDRVRCVDVRPAWGPGWSSCTPRAVEHTGSRKGHLGRRGRTDWERPLTLRIHTGVLVSGEKCRSWFGPLLSGFPPWSHDRHLVLITEMTWFSFFPLLAKYLIATKAGKHHSDPKGALPSPRPYSVIQWERARPAPCVCTALRLPHQHLCRTVPSSRVLGLFLPIPAPPPRQMQVSVKRSLKPSLISQLQLNSLTSKHLRNFVSSS